MGYHDSQLHKTQLKISVGGLKTMQDIFLLRQLSLHCRIHQNITNYVYIFISKVHSVHTCAFNHKIWELLSILFYVQFAF